MTSNNTQPTALELADRFEEPGLWWLAINEDLKRAAIELRRLHAENEVLKVQLSGANERAQMLCRRKELWRERAAASENSLAPVQALLDMHAELLEANPYAYFELAYTRQTGWMAWITDKPFHGPVTNPDRKVLARGQGDTPAEACANAEKTQKGGA